MSVGKSKSFLLSIIYLPLFLKEKILNHNIKSPDVHACVCTHACTHALELELLEILS